MAGADYIVGGNFKTNNTSTPKPIPFGSLFSLHGKTAIVSGAGAGIGLVSLSSTNLTLCMDVGPIY